MHGHRVEVASMSTRTWCFGFMLIVAGCSSASDADTGDPMLSGESGGGARVDTGSNGGSSTAGNAANNGGSTVPGGSGGSGSAGSSSVSAGAGGSPAPTPDAGNQVPTNDGGPPHVVEACPMGAGAPGAIGVWEDVTPTPLKTSKAFTPTGAILVNPKDTRIVYAGSEGSGLFKSTDCGASFVHASTGMSSSSISSGRMWDMVIDPVEPDTLYTVEGYGAGGLWKTTNGGVDWVNTTPDGSEVAKTANGNFTSIIGMDVTNHLHLVLAFHSGCGGAFAPNCQAETTDGGKTWRLFKAPIAGEGVGVIVLGPKTWLSSGYQEVQETTDGGATWKKVSGVSAHWQLYQSPKTGAYFIGSQQGIIKSENGTDWTMIPGFSQPVQGIAGDGTNIYAGQQWGTKAFKIPEASSASFSELPSKPSLYFLSCDVDHHLLYGSDMHQQWRLRTQ
jgi:hypothetical protein